MLTVALTGSIAMGKSTAAANFAALGVPVFDSDTEVRRLYAQGGEAVAAVGAAFPGVVVEGRVDRGLLASRVFRDPAALRHLEGIVHPLVERGQREFVEKCRSEKRGLAVLDIPLLFETGRDREFDRIVVVSAPEGIQRLRALKRPGMTEEKLQSILARQLPDAEKRKRAHYVIDTSHAHEEGRHQVRRIVDELSKEMEAMPE